MRIKHGCGQCASTSDIAAREFVEHGIRQLNVTLWHE
jgi:hypothetical protein